MSSSDEEHDGNSEGDDASDSENSEGDICADCHQRHPVHAMPFPFPPPPPGFVESLLNFARGMPLYTPSLLIMNADMRPHDSSSDESSEDSEDGSIGGNKPAPEGTVRIKFKVKYFLGTKPTGYEDMPELASESSSDDDSETASNSDADDEMEPAGKCIACS